MLFNFFKKNDSSDDSKKGLKCPSDKELTLYLLNKANPEETARLDQHIKGCDQCQEDLEELKTIADSEI